MTVLGDADDVEGFTGAERSEVEGMQVLSTFTRQHYGTLSFSSSHNMQITPLPSA